MSRDSRPRGVMCHILGIMKVNPRRRSTECSWSWNWSRLGLNDKEPDCTLDIISVLVMMDMGLNSKVKIQKAKVQVINQKFEVINNAVRL